MGLAAFNRMRREKAAQEKPAKPVEQDDKPADKPGKVSKNKPGKVSKNKPGKGDK